MRGNYVFSNDDNLSLALIDLHSSFISDTILPLRNPIVKRILMSILIGNAIQVAVITTIPGYLIVFLLFDDSLKAGRDENDWRILLVSSFPSGSSALRMDGTTTQVRDSP